MKYFKRNLSLILVLTLIFSNIIGLKTNATTDYLPNDNDITSDENTENLLTLSGVTNSAIDLSTLTVVADKFTTDTNIKVTLKSTNGELRPEDNKYIHMSIKYILPNGSLSREDFFTFNKLTNLYEANLTLGRDLDWSPSYPGLWKVSEISLYLCSVEYLDGYYPDLYPLGVIEKNSSIDSKYLNLGNFTLINTPPEIWNVSDISLKINTDFDPYYSILAYDYDDVSRYLPDIEEYTRKRLIIEGTVDTSTPGIYELKYKVTDNDYATTEVIRLVTVLPNENPIIYGAEDKTIKIGDSFNPLEGVTAFDDEEGDLTSKIKVIKNNVDINKIGTYEVIYAVTDSNDATTTATRKITVRSNTNPVFSGMRNTTVNKGQVFNPLSGISAYDNEDGDLTSKIKVSGSVDTAIIGDYTLNYSVTDSDGNTTTAPRIISVVSTSKPIISGVDDITINVGTTFDPKSGVTAKDADGNDLTSSISIAGKVDTSKPGKYSLVYSVTDKYKNTVSATRIVTVRSTNKPVFYGEKYVTIKVGDKFDPRANIIAKDAEDGDLTDKIIILGKVDTSTPGVYTLEYSVTDSDENKTTIYRIITVEAKAKEVQVQSIIGNNRYETAVLLSKSQFDSANTVVIANGSSLADGLTVTPLAAYKKAPILLTEVNRLPSETKAEISRLGATNAIIVGGTGVVSTDVAKELYSLGIVNIQRLGGKDRYETSLEIAKYIDKYCYDVSKVVISNGGGEPDALSISSVAGRDRMPILLTPIEGLTDSIYDWLKSESLKTAYIIGGTGVVPDSILYKVNEITSDNILNNRLGGQNRYDTNAQVINRFYDKELDKVYIAKGFVLIDALSAGPIAALNNAPVVLAGNDLSDEQKGVLTERTGNLIIRTGGGIYDKAVNSLKACLK